MLPWYKNFKGKIERAEGNNYTVTGVWRKLDRHTLQITELPIRRWTRDYKTMLEDMMMKGEIEDLKEFHKDNTVDFIIKLKDDITSLEREPNGIEKRFRLTTSLSANNMVLFDKDQKIKKYPSELGILEEFYTLRYEFYEKRKTLIIKQLQHEISILENKSRFITELISGELKIQNKPKDQVISIL